MMRAALLALIPMLAAAQTPAPAPAPLTLEERGVLHLRRVASPLAVLAAGAGAGLGQWRDEPEAWGGGMAGFGRRYASSHGYIGAQNVFHFALGAAFREEPRYSRSGQGRISARIRRAVGTTFVTGAPHVRGRYNFALFGSHLGAAMVANQWHPTGDDRIGDGFRRAAIGIGLAALRNVAAEFVPDITARVFRRSRQPGQQR